MTLLGVVSRSRGPAEPSRYATKSLMLDPNDIVHLDNCDSTEQQDARVMHRWGIEPNGSYAGWMTHERRLRITVGFFIGRVLRRSADPRFKSYMSGDVNCMESEQLLTASYRFAGATEWGDGQTNRMWISPFILDVAFSDTASEMPSRAALKFGLDNDGAVLRKPRGIHNERDAIAQQVFDNRPTRNRDWAVIVNLDPYNLA